MDSKDIIALAAYLHKLADPEQEAMPSFDNVDWRSLSYRCAKAIEALQADAARYRWVRDPESDSPLMFSPGSYNAKYGLVDLEDMLVGASLDAAIDAAMALDKP